MSDSCHPVADLGPSLRSRRRFLGSLSALCATPLLSLPLGVPTRSAQAATTAGTGMLPRPALRASLTASNVPFCFAQGLAPGALAAGQTLACSAADLQARVLNRWPDGSAKLALLSGEASLEAGIDQPLDLHPTAATAGLEVSESDLAAVLPPVTLTFAGNSAVLNTLLGQTSSRSGDLWLPGRVRTLFAGPWCSAWQYCAPLDSAGHLSAWFEVRCWRSGAVELLAWIENGRLLLPTPTSVTAAASLVIGAQSVFSASLTLRHHTRCLLASGGIGHRIGSAAPAEVLHDVSYLQRSLLVPAYFGQTPANSPLFNRLHLDYAPFAQANFPTAMGAAGYHPSIGLLPEWDAAFLTSGGHPDALRAVLANAACAGRYGLIYRDETSNQPPRFSQYPHLVLHGSSGVSGTGSSTTNQRTPAPSGDNPPSWATSHHPSIGYLAYLTTGWHYFAEQIQFAACVGFLKQTDSTRGFAEGRILTEAGSNTTRGAAWTLRSLAQAACVTPDDDPLAAQLRASVAANIDYYHARYVASPSNPQGFCAPYSDYTSGDGVYFHASWMEDFLTASFGYLLSLELVDAERAARLRALFAWKARSIIGRLGAQGDPTQFNYRDAARYTLAVAPADSIDWQGGGGPWYADFGQIYQASLGHANDPEPDQTLRGAYYPEPTSYWGNLQPAIAYAVQHQVPGASDAYRRMTTASNWTQIEDGFDHYPVWGVRPADALSHVFRDGFEQRSD
jgi:hypothetical protein